MRKSLYSDVDGHTSGAVAWGVSQVSGALRENLQITKGCTVIKSLVAEHLLCNATVQTLNGNPFHAHTMIDSGSQSSLISEDFVRKHLLASIPLRPAIPIHGLDGRPLSRGSITHVVSLNLKIGDHSELKTFGIVNMPWDLLLGIDWLQTHNLEINWKSGSI